MNRMVSTEVVQSPASRTSEPNTRPFESIGSLLRDAHPDLVISK
jgi:hypothetical protein